MSEVIRATSVDHRPELEELRRLVNMKVGKLELGQTLKANTAVIEELGKEAKQLREALSEVNSELESLRAKHEDTRQD